MKVKRVYIAFDGKEFGTFEEAEAYEATEADKVFEASTDKDSKVKNFFDNASPSVQHEFRKAYITHLEEKSNG